jgi:2-C-methyl-D-erythritol 2,4-cyclodiphosphate synthase
VRVATGIGQDSHRFEGAPSGKPLRIGGVTFDGAPALDGNSDADVLLHAAVNALSGLHGVTVLGPVTDVMCKAGVTDSAHYVTEAMKHLGTLRLSHCSCSLECLKPKIGPRIPELRASLAALLGLHVHHVAVTAHSGEGLTAFGRGEGILATVILTAHEE